MRFRISTAIFVSSLTFSAHAATVVIDPISPQTQLWVGANDGVGSSVGDNAAPVAIPFSGQHSVNEGAASASAMYDLSNDRLEISFDLARPGTDLTGLGEAFGHIRFSVDVDVAYQLQGTISAIDSEGRRVHLQASLSDLGGGELLFSNFQSSTATPNETFSLGATEGDDQNGLFGSLSGTIIGGTEHRLSYTAFIKDEPSPALQAAAASGLVTLTFVSIDSDSDGTLNENDNCYMVPNPDQSNIDADANGDLCDSCPSDPTDTCDPARSAAAEIPAASGGTVATGDGGVTMTIPPGALSGDTTISITDTGSDFELTSNLGQVLGVFGVDIAPDGTTFNSPVTLVFAWDDADDDGKVDGTNVNESNLLITKDNIAITDRCFKEAGCDVATNTFTFQVSSLSEFVIGALISTVPALSRDALGLLTMLIAALASWRILRQGSV